MNEDKMTNVIEVNNINQVLASASAMGVVSDSVVNQAIVELVVVNNSSELLGLLIDFGDISFNTSQKLKNKTKLYLMEK